MSSELNDTRRAACKITSRIIDIFSIRNRACPIIVRVKTENENENENENECVQICANEHGTKLKHVENRRRPVAKGR